MCSLILRQDDIIVLVKRKEKVMIPNGNLILREGDMVILYSEMRIANVTEIEI